MKHTMNKFKMENDEIKTKIVESLSRKTLYIHKVEFFNWLFSDTHDWSNVVDDLIEYETIHLKDYLDSAGYIPTRVIENKNNLTKEQMENGEVENPEDYNLELIK